MRRSALAAFAAASLAPALAASGAHATAGPLWTPPVGVGVLGDTNLNPQVSMGAGGDVAAIARDYDTQRLTGQVHPAGGVWEPAVPLSTAGKEVGPYAVATATEDDTVVAVWGENTPIDMGPGGTRPGPNRLYSSVHAAGGGWSAPVALSADGSDVSAPVVATAADGRAIVLWTQSDHNVYASIRSVDGTWSAPSVAGSGSGMVSALAVEFRPDGSVVAVWQRDYTVESSVLHGSTWSPVTTVAAAGGAVQMDVAADDGEVTVVWNDSGEHVRVLSPVDDAWGEPTLVSAPGASAYYEPNLAVADDGTAVLAWSDAESSTTVYWASKRAADGTWSAPEQLGTGSSERPTSAAGDDGIATVAWKSLDAPSPIRSKISLGGTFSFGQFVGDFSTSGDQAVMSGDGRGSAAIVYLEGGSDSRVSFLDHSGPALRRLTVPKTARVGEPVSMSVDAADAYSTVSSLEWSFGDGEGVSGESHPTHAFAAPGTYKVKITSEDANGFTTSEKRTIVVAAQDDDGDTDDASTPDDGGPDMVTRAPVADPVPVPPATPAPPVEQAKPAAPALAAPTVMLAHRQKLATILSRQAIRTTVVAPAAGTLKVTATVSGADAKRLGLKTTRLAVTTTKVKAKSDAKISLKLSAGVRRRAAKLKTLNVTLTVVFTSTDGHTTTTKTKLATRA